MKKIIFLTIIPCFIYPNIQENIELVEQEQEVIEEFYTKAPTPTKPLEITTNAGQIQKTITLTKPIIIDSNNPDFDGVSKFTFPCNIIYKPDPNYSNPFIYNNYTGAFIVNKDNITIDFNGYNLSFQAPATSNFMINNPTYGIAIYQGVKNLRIISSSPNGSNQITHKGSITNFTGYAIFGSGSTQSYNSYDVYSLRIKNLFIDNLLITQNKNGIYLENALNPSITNTNIIYNYSPQILYGIYFDNILGGLIDTCDIQQNWSYIDIYGMFLQDTTNLIVQNCQTGANRSLRNGNATGILLTASTASASSSDNLISNCTANRNLCANVEGKSSIGFFVNNLSRHNTIENCTSLNSGHTDTAGVIPPIVPVDAVGFKFDSSNLNTINNNTSGFHLGYGFHDTAGLSTSFYTSNTAMYCGINYQVNVPDKITGVPVPLAVTDLYSNDTSAATGSGPIYANYSVQLQQ